MKKLQLFFTLLMVCLSNYPSALLANTVSEYQLKNGLTVLVKEDHRSPIIMSLLMYHIGSSYEPNGITGISHALEHMMFKGTKNVGKGQFSKTISDNGGSLNAFTGEDYTGYHVNINVDKLPLVMQLEADRMQNLILSEEEFKKEIEVVKEERHMRVENNPNSLTYEHFLAAAFLAIPYHNPVIGWPSDLDNMTVNDLKNWYQQWYLPNNATLVIVGDVIPSDVFKMAEKYFGNIAPKKLPEIKTFSTVPAYGLREVIIKRPAQVPSLLIGFNVPTVTTAKEKWEPYALKIAASILSMGDSSRFGKQLIRKQEVAAGASAYYGIYYRLPHLFTIAAMPAKNKKIPALKQAILAEIKKIQVQAIDPSELDKVKALIIADDVYDKDSITSQALKYGALSSIGLSWQESSNFKKQVEAITAEQVQAVANKYLVPEQMTVAILKPQNDNLVQTKRKEGNH